MLYGFRHNDFAWNARRFVYNKLSGVNLTSSLRHARPWNESVWSHTDLARLKSGMVGAQASAMVSCLGVSLKCHCYGVTVTG